VRELDALLAAPCAEGPLASWLLHTARAEVANLGGDKRGLAAHAGRAEALARGSESPLFVARHERWRARF
jgi:hypothetical protein